MTQHHTFFLPYQSAWIRDNSPLKLMEKSRQVGISFADAYDSVMKAAEQGARLDVWVSSRDEAQARLYLEDCKRWAELLQIAAKDLGTMLFDKRAAASAHTLEFPNGRRIYSLSSNPDALAGKRGHVKLDEFALHQDQRLLYRVAKPVTTWGGQLCVISTHRGVQTVFCDLVRAIKEGGNPMGWSLHTVPLQKAVEQGLVERINSKLGREESREAFLKRLRAECLDEEQWLQEYCCVPADESSAFITYDMLQACEDASLQLLSVRELIESLAPTAAETAEAHPVSPRAQTPLLHPRSALYLGVDVARRNDLCVLDVGEKIGDVVWDRARVELQGKTFAEIEAELYALLKLPQLKRACIDGTGLGIQLAERAEERFGWKVEPVTFTAASKEELAFGLRTDFENRHLRLVADDKLRADLRGMKKAVTSSGNIRFEGESGDSHCDRFWAKALRQQAARYRTGAGAFVG